MAIRNNNISSRKIYIGTSTEVVPNDGDALISGNVGIGTNDPGAKLHVTGVIRAYDSSNTYYANMTASSSWGYFNTNAAKIYLNKEIRVDTGLIGSYNEALQLRTSGTTRMYINSSTGNVGIGTTSPSERLEVVGNIKLSGTQYVSKSSSANITPNAGDWIDIAYMPYGEHHGLIALEWNGISAPSCCHHGWAQFSVGTYYSSNFNYGQDTYVELVKAHAHNDFWLEAVRAVDVGSTVRIQVKFSRTVVSGSFVSYVLSQGQGTITPYQPYVNNNSYTVLANANVGKIDGEEVQKAFANPVRFSGKTSFDDNVGIGTTSPGQKLHITSNTTYDGIVVEGSSIPRIAITDTTNTVTLSGYSRDNDATIGTETNHPLTINTNGSERMRITSGGNVGIGTTSPSDKLQLQGDGTYISVKAGDGSNGVKLGTDSSGDGLLQLYSDSGVNNIKLYGEAASPSYINAGNVGIGTTSPGAKLDVQGAVTIKGSGTGTSGSLAIQDDYSGENHLGNIGWIRSSGGVYLSYGLKQENSAEWKSTYANFSGQRTYAKLDNNEFSMAHAPDQDTAVGTAVTGLTEKFKFYLNTGILQLNSYSAGILSTSSNGTVGIASSGDLPGGPYLPLAGGTMTGDLVLTSAGTANNATLQIDNPSTATFIHSIEALGANLTANQNNIILVGKTGDTKNSGYIGYKWKADASNSNILTFGHWGSDNLMNLTADGNVGIGTTGPEVGLHVKGSAVDNKSLLYIENEYLDGGVFFPAAKFTNLRSNHSFGIVSEFRTENAAGTDRPAILFSHNHTDWNWTIGQGVYSANDNFSIGSRSSHPGSGTAGWATPRLTIVPSNGNVGINETSPGAKLEVGGNIAASDQVSVNNRTAISVAHWSGQTATTGAIKISLPGSHGGNWSMIVLRITTYEYNSNNHTVYYVSGHDWTSGWYNNGVTKIGDSDKDISLAYDSNKDYVIVGETTSSWAYGHVTVDVMAHPSFYSNSMDIRSGWGISQDADLTGITIQSVTNRKVLTSADAYYTESESDDRFVNVNGDTMTGDLTLNGNFYLNPSSTEVTMSGNTSGNFTIDNNTGQIAFQANGSTVNSMTITSSQITLNEISQVNNVLRTLTGMGDTTQWDSADLRLETTDTINTTGFQGLRFATSTANNYGWRVGANRRDSGRGSLRFYEHTGAATGFERFTIAEDGNVGIGATSPTQKLEVVGNIRAKGDDPKIYVTSTAINGRDYSIQSLQFGTFGIYDGTTSRLSITSNGNVGIGTTSPGEKLEVVGSNALRIHDGTDQGSIFFRGDRDDVYIKESNYQLLFGAPSGMVFELDTNGNNGDFFNVTHRGSSRFYINGATGNVGIGTTSPSFPLHINTSNDIVGYFKSTDNKASIIIADNDTTGYVSAENDRVSIGYGVGASTANITIVNGSYNVGIGTTSPNEKLHVAGNIHAYAAGGIDAGLYASTSGGITTVAVRSSGITHFNGGNVGIGITSPGEKLEVSGSFKIGNIKIQNALTGRIGFNRNTSTGAIYDSSYSAFQINGPTTSTGSLTIESYNNTGGFLGTVSIKAGDVTANNFILSSDETLKEDIKDLNVKVDAKWRSYKFKDSEETRYGVIAQELEETNPELVRTNDEGLKSVAYVDLLIAKIAELEARLEKAGL